ncbi:hypothetical protein [Sorangium sp. So ce176]|uniref:hypothetical protein n=1 Tax=Sorangium sp. So ce176 TaxID=3133286 RepID=UPI003F62A136
MTSSVTVPDDDTFYHPRIPLEGEHGEVIWSRPLTGPAALASARVNQLVLHRSRDVHGKAIAVSGIVALPRKAPPEGGYPIVSWAHGTVGCADTGCTRTCSASPRRTASSRSRRRTIPSSLASTSA